MEITIWTVKVLIILFFSIHNYDITIQNNYYKYGENELIENMYATYNSAEGTSPCRRENFTIENIKHLVDQRNRD